MIRRIPVSVVPGAIAGILILASGCAEHSPTAVEFDAPEATVESIGGESGKLEPGSVGRRDGQIVLIST